MYKLQIYKKNDYVFHAYLYFFYTLEKQVKSATIAHISTKKISTKKQGKNL